MSNNNNNNNNNNNSNNNNNNSGNNNNNNNNLTSGQGVPVQKRSLFKWFSTSSIHGSQSTNTSSSSISTPVDLITTPELHFKETEEYKELLDLWGKYKSNLDDLKKDSLHQMIKLFLKVCPETCDCYAFCSIFGDGSSFANIITKFLISDISTITSSPLVNKEKTILSLAKLFLDDPSELGSEYIDILFILSSKDNLISSFDDSVPLKIIQVLETLIIFSQSEIQQHTPSDIKEPVQKFTSFAKRLYRLLHIFMKNGSMNTGLMKHDAISTLVRMISSKGCPEENIYMKQIAFDILRDAFESVGAAFVSHLHQKKSIRLLLNSLKHSNESHFHTIAITIKSLIYILKKSCNTSMALLNDFVSSNGYQITMDAILQCEEHFDEHTTAMNEMLKNAADLVFIGDKPLVPIEEMDKTSNQQAKGNRIKSLDAYQSLSNSFLRSKNPSFQVQVVSNFLYIFAEDSMNYPCVDHLHNITLFIKNLNDASPDVQVNVLKLLEYIIAGLNFVPHEEIESLALLFQSRISPDLALLVLNTIHKLLKFDSKFKEHFRKAKLLVSIVTVLRSKFDMFLQNENEKESELHVKLLESTIEVLQSMLENEPLNVQQFRDAGGISALQSLLVSSELSRDYALRVFQVIIVQDTFQKQCDVTTLVEVLQTSDKSTIHLKLSIFNALRKMFFMNDRSKDSFREAGFVSTVSVLINTPWPTSSDENPSEEEVIELIECLFKALTAALSNHQMNKLLFIKFIGHAAICDALMVNGVMSSPYRGRIYQCLLDFGTERSLGDYPTSDEQKIDFLVVPRHARLVNPFAMKFMMELSLQQDDDTRFTIVKVINYLASVNVFNLEMLSTINVVQFIVDNFGTCLHDMTHSSHEMLIETFRKIATHKLSSLEWRLVFKLLQFKEHPITILRALKHISKESNATPFINLEPLSRCTILSLEDRTCATTAYTFCSWVFFENLSPHSSSTVAKQTKHNFTLLKLRSSDNKTNVMINFSNDGILEIQSGKYNPVQFSKYIFLPKKWYHVAIIHQRQSFFQNSTATLVVNGRNIQQEKVSYFGGASTGLKVKGYIGKNRAQHTNTWRIGPSLLYEDALPVNTISSIYLAGSTYLGCFQGAYLSIMSLKSDFITEDYLGLITPEIDKFSELNQAPHVSSVKLLEEKIIFVFHARHNQLVDITEHLSEIYSVDIKKIPSNAICLFNVKNGKKPVGILGGNFGCCCPSTLADVSLNLDGIYLVFALLERAETSDYLMEVMSLLGELMKYPKIIQELERINGYFIISSFLRKKSNLLTSKILEALWNMVVINQGPASQIISNNRALSIILLDYEVWKKTSIHLQEQLFALLINLISKACEFAEWNVMRLKSIHIVPILLRILEQSPPVEIVEIIIDVLRSFFDHYMNFDDISQISAFLLCSIDADLNSIQSIASTPKNPISKLTSSIPSDSPPKKTMKKKSSTIVAARNLILKALLELITQKKDDTYIETFAKVANMKWFYQFIYHKVHPTSMTLIIQLLSALIISGHLRNDKIEGLLKQGLIPYCNQCDIYYSLFCLMMGIHVVYKNHYERKGDPVLFSDLVINCASQQEIPVFFPPAIPIILTLLKFNHKGSTSILYRPMSTFSYFLQFEKNFSSDDSTPTLHVPNKGKLVFDEFDAVDVFPNSSQEEDTITLDEMRMQLSLNIVDFLNTLFTVSTEFKIECKKIEILEPLIAILFSNPLFSKTYESQRKDSLGIRYNSTVTLSDRSQTLASHSFSILSDKNHFDENFNNSVSRRIFDLLTAIVTDEFGSTYKGTKLIEDIIQSCPISGEMSNQFTTIIISNVIKNYNMAGRFKDIGSNSKLASNLTQLCSFIIDLFYMEILSVNFKEPCFKFIVTIINQLEAAEGVGFSILSKVSLFGSASTLSLIRDTNMNGMFRSLNRGILFLLTTNGDNATALVNVMNTIVNQEDWFITALRPINKDQEFFSCLIYLLYKFLLDDSNSVRLAAINIWKLLVSSRIHSPLVISLMTFKNSNGEVVDLVSGFKKILEKDTKNFMEWLEKEKDTIAFHFDTNHGSMLENYRQTEKKYASSKKDSWMKSLMNRKTASLNKDRKNVDYYHVMAKDCKLDIKNINLNQDKKTKARIEQGLITLRYAVARWQVMKVYLHTDRSLWGPKTLELHHSDTEGSTGVVTQWKLDYTEGPCRMRKKLEAIRHMEETEIVNSSNTPPKNTKKEKTASEQTTPEEQKKPKYILAQYRKLEELQMSPNRLKEFDIADEQPTASDTTESATSQTPVENFTKVSSSMIDPNQNKDIDEDDDFEAMEDEVDSAKREDDDILTGDFKFRKLLAFGEDILHRFNCLRITGLDGQKGIFLICKKKIYIIDNFSITENGDIVEVSGEHNTLASHTPERVLSSGDLEVEHDVIEFFLSDIVEVHKRRFLLRMTALELFCNNGRNYFVVFEKSEMQKVFTCIGKNKCPNAQSEIQKYQYMWQKGDISNFEYLMLLNTMAGRSYNDFTQYPVFPWILSDYSSETLDLTDPSVYRDLSKPMGALNEKRKAMYIERYDIWDDEDIPKFHYGTHYSSAAIVLYYLLRLEPFTSQNIELQGGRFDIADRLFYSVQDTWISASSDYAMSDVKELIPEFFYLPEFLRNSNKRDLGKRQNGEYVGDVALPPWAKGDASEFIRIHREALESDYVSEHLHEWIDLIFGYKQQGKEAEKAVNIFYYLTYEGAVDIDAIEDDIQKQATISQISNFGQTPLQLFTKPHPKRNVQLIKQRLAQEAKFKFYLHPDEVVGILEKTLQDHGGVGYLKCKDLSIGRKLRVSTLTSSSNTMTMTSSGKEQLLSLPKCSIFIKPKYNKFFTWGHADHSLRLFKIPVVGIGSLHLGETAPQLSRVWESLHTSQISCLEVDEKGKWVAIGGYDGSISIYKMSKNNKEIQMSLKSRLCGHRETVQCLSISNHFNIIVSGSNDCTCIVWDFNELRYVRELKALSPITSVRVHPENGNIFVCSHTTVHVWNINGEVMICADIGRVPITSICLSSEPSYLGEQYLLTGHKDGTIKIWKISYGGNVIDSQWYSSNSFLPSNNSFVNIPSNSINVTTVAPSPITPTTPVRAPSTSSITSSFSDSKCNAKLLLISEKQKSYCAITQLTVSKDHKRLYSGDEKGSIYCWSVPALQQPASQQTSTPVTSPQLTSSG